MDKTFREDEQPLTVARIGGAEQLRDWRTRRVKCPVSDPLCVANHLESDYCFHESTGTAVPEAPEGVGAVVISSGTLDTQVSPEAPVEVFTYDPALEPIKAVILPPVVQSFVIPSDVDTGLSVGSDIHLSGRPITITEIKETEGGREYSYEFLTPERYAQRWTKNWINFDLEALPVAERTGRRVDRRDKLVKSFSTPLRYPFARGCGHQFVELQKPRHSNCETCWNAFFWNQGEFTENIARNVQEQGPEVVQAIHGKKFLTHFLRFAILLARYEQFKNTAGTECATVEAEREHVHDESCEGDHGHSSPVAG